MSWIEANVYQVDHDFAVQDYIQQVTVPHFLVSNQEKNLYVSLVTKDDRDSIGQLMYLTVYENSINFRRTSYGVTIEVTSDGQSDSVTIKNGQVPGWDGQVPTVYGGYGVRIRDPNWKDPCFYATLFEGRQMFLNWMVRITVTFNAWPSRVSNPKTVLVDLLTYALAGNQVTLVGSDGEVKASAPLLKARSPAFQAMLTYDTKEKQESQIGLEDFDVKTLKAFVHFLVTDKVVFDKDTILGLYLLGDKYDLQLLKFKARNFTLEHIKELDPKKVFDVVSMIDTDMIEKCSLKKYAS